MVVIALLILTFLTTGRFAIKNGISPSGGGSTGGWDDQIDPDG